MNQEIYPKSKIHTVPDYRYMKIQKEIWSDIEKAIVDDAKRVVFGYAEKPTVNHITALFDSRVKG